MGDVFRLCFTAVNAKRRRPAAGGLADWGHGDVVGQGQAHVVHAAPGEPDLLFIDLHLIHEVTSPQAFDGLRLNGRALRRPDLTVATMDHNVPTTDTDQPGAGPDLEEADGGPSQQLRRVRGAPLPDGRPGAGHRPHHRAGAGPDASWHDDRVRG